MKIEDIRSIGDLDRAIEHKEHQLEIRELTIRQDVRSLLDIPATVKSIIDRLRKRSYE